MMDLIHHTAVANVVLTVVRGSRIPLPFLAAMLQQSRVLLPHTKLPTCEGEGLHDVAQQTRHPLR